MGDDVSLLAKWLPSVNASNAQTVAYAKKIARFLGMTDATYRKTLVKLREHIRIIENSLREKDYSFDYSKQPSKAMFKYRRASMPLMYGDYRTLHVDDDVVVFLRHYMGEWAVVALNIRPEARSVEVAMPEFVEAASANVALAAEGGKAVLAEGKIALDIPAYGYVIVNK